MALIKCPECRKKFSDRASACPSCGAPVSLAIAADKDAKKQAKAILAIGAIVLAGVALTRGERSGPADGDPKVAAQKAVIDERRAEEAKEVQLQRSTKIFVSQYLKDPDSAKFRNQKGLCGEVNSKNSFGGYTGFQRFIALGNAGVALEGDTSLKKGQFRELWSKICQ